MGIDANICPSCNEKNNPAFLKCWKCGGVFATGGIAAQQLRKAEEGVRKRSKGVTILGWMFILDGIQWVTSFNSYVKTYGIGLSAFSIAMAVVALACGVFILRLHPVARKVAIALSLVALILIPFYFVPYAKSFHPEKAYAKKEKFILEKVSPEHQEEQLRRLKELRKGFARFVPVILFFLFGAYASLNLCYIYFLMRPTVKKQFERPNF